MSRDENANRIGAFAIGTHIGLENQTIMEAGEFII
jgi:hypothetical protein